MEKLYLIKLGKGLQNNVTASDVELIREEQNIPEVTSLFFSGTTNKTLELSFSDGSSIFSNSFSTGSNLTFSEGLTESAGNVTLGGTITDTNYREILFQGGSGLYLYDGVDTSGLGLYIDKVDASSSSILMEATDFTGRGDNRARLTSGSGSFTTGRGFYTDTSFPTRLVTSAVRGATAVIGQAPILTEMVDPNGVGNVEFQNVLHDVVQGTNVTIDKTDPFNPIINVTSAGSLPGGALGDELFHDGSTFIKATPVKDKQTGITITTVTLPSTPLVGSIVDVYRNGLLQNNPEDYSITGNTITFVNTLVASDIIITQYKTA